jgi:hypothetical protein
MAFPLLILYHITPSCAATRRNRNLVADDCATVALERIQPDGSPLHWHQVSTGLSLNVHQAPALPTAPSARTGVPVKHAQGLHSSSDDDDEPPHLISGGFEGGDTMAAMCIERMERKGRGWRPPPRADPAHFGPRPAASYFEQGIIHLLLSLPQLTLWPTAVSWTPPPPASSIKDNAPSDASLDFSVGATQLILHAASC